MYDLITATSMGVRITPPFRQPVGIGNEYVMQSTSAESNVLNISASLGLKTKVLTAFVKDSPIAAFIRRDLARRGIESEGPEFDQGGPWGYRHQFNIADSGFGLRAPRVHNDRAGEVGRALKPEHFDLEKVFVRDGAKMMHFSGLFAALSPDTVQLCLSLAEKAKAHGTRISFDLNYRASFWKGREVELRDAFHRIASVSDVLIGNEEDYQLALGIQGPHAGGRDIDAQIDEFKDMIMEATKVYPQVKVFATTLREVYNANEHLWGAILYKDGKWHLAEPRTIQVLDRIGGGDGFVGGLLYGLLKGWDGEKCVQFGWATGAMAVTMLEDYASPADENQVWSVWQGNARVVR
ncbi:MAG: PfkB family carbohydrate kinase [Candidatus Excrementavichristensenella sp.]|jgi:2-dehydro-3-deoxygluconokinase|nr:PfkB family carbohydrate kinase [Bacillota bacterium]